MLVSYVDPGKPPNDLISYGIDVDGADIAPWVSVGVYMGWLFRIHVFLL